MKWQTAEQDVWVNGDHREFWIAPGTHYSTFACEVDAEDQAHAYVIYDGLWGRAPESSFHVAQRYRIDDDFWHGSIRRYIAESPISDPFLGKGGFTHRSQGYRAP